MTQLKTMQLCMWQILTRIVIRAIPGVNYSPPTYYHNARTHFEAFEHWMHWYVYKTFHSLKLYLRMQYVIYVLHHALISKILIIHIRLYFLYTDILTIGEFKYYVGLTCPCIVCCNTSVKSDSGICNCRHN